MLTHKIVASIFCAFLLISCGTTPQIKYGPYCDSDAAQKCHTSGIAFGTDEMQACIKDIQRRCAQGPEVQAKPLSPLESCLKNAKQEVSLCILGQIGMPGSTRGIQICQDRERMQEDRCYARFK